MMNQLSISEYNPRMEYCDKFQSYRVIESNRRFVVAELVSLIFFAKVCEISIDSDVT
ncbi:MAG: hypothetical protein UDS45_01515 [Lachnospiraceae bacterium]|nr:hypothetical protein [Lachnospiraceae bacterium]